MAPHTCSGTSQAPCHHLSSTDGLDQGDPLAPIIFALGLAPHLNALESRLRDMASAQGLDPNRVHILAYLDDISIIVPPTMAVEALEAASVAFLAFGLSLRLQKT